jgi:hypothetical protein
MDLTLTNDQSEALSRILEFMHSKVMGQFMLLEGKAGTGKTTLMKMVVRYNNKMGSSRLRILAAAMTHKARKVIEKALNEGGMITIPSKTIANLLKKQRLNSYLGHKKFGAGGNSMADFDFIIVDEASMLNDIDLEKLIEAARLHKTKILFIADAAQIPHPTQRLVNLAPDLLVKADSAVFKLKNRANLKEIVRQKEGNPVLDVALHIRNNLFCTEPYGPYQHIDNLKTMEITQSVQGRDGALAANPGISEVEKNMIGYPIRNMPGAYKSANSEPLKDKDKDKGWGSGHVLGSLQNVSDKQHGLEAPAPAPTKSIVQVGVRFVTSVEFEQLIVRELQGWNRGEWKDPFEVRILSYTNESVRTYNRLARNARYLPIKEETDTIAGIAGHRADLEPIMVGDLLMGYENLGFPTPYIENGQDYLVVGVRKVDNHPIVIGPGPSGKILAVGYLVTLGETMFDSMDVVPATVKTHFFPDVDNEKNLPILHELRFRAKLVNQPNSSTKSFKHYHELKDQLIFMECLYEFKGKIYGEAHFFREHPLLATNVSELLKEEINPVNQPGISSGPINDITPGRVRGVAGTAVAGTAVGGAGTAVGGAGTAAAQGLVKNEDNPRPKGQRSIRKHFLYEQIASLYPNLVEERMMSYHMLSDSEELGDRFLFIDKDIDFGYAITSHKAQASTYNRVYINDADIAKIRDRWNYEYNGWYRGSKERNQLKYVAVTRARHLVTVLSILKEQELERASELQKNELQKESVFSGNLFNKDEEFDEEPFDSTLPYVPSDLLQTV